VAAPGAHAQGKPRQPLRVIVPLPPGSTSDAGARALAERLGGGGPPVIVENRAGASGRLAVEALKGGTADGGTLLFAPIAVPVILPIVTRFYPLERFPQKALYALEELLPRRG
jgi:tripartite-type tricarboxylate transporter receptor subunit TctC